MSLYDTILKLKVEKNLSLIWIPSITNRFEIDVQVYIWIVNTIDKVMSPKEKKCLTKFFFQNDCIVITFENNRDTRTLVL